jgi:uncharacterized repeat protein (TIGR01451 family)
MRFGSIDWFSYGLRNALTLCWAICLFLTSTSAGAVYVQRFNTTTNGAITFTGNTLGLDGGNVSGNPGSQGSIGAFTTTDTTQKFGNFPFGTTNNWQLNSSSAVLTIPPGSTILYAELIWGGSYSYGGASVANNLNTPVTFQTPLGNYSVAPAPATSQTAGTANGSGGCTVTTPTTYCRYVRSANVTGFVQIGQGGTYTVRGVPATANTEPNNNTAGWTLAVVYANPSLPPRNMTLFVGDELGGAAPTTVSGFCTNLAGPVKGRLAVSSLEGDVAIAGDNMMFGPTVANMTAQSGPNNLSTNFFNSQINGDSGSLVTTGTFGNLNHGATAIAGSRQGYSITNVDVSQSLTNGQTFAVAQGTTTGDQYTITGLGIQIDVGAPKFPVSVKSANRTTTYVGDTVTYTVSLDNTAGTASATNVVVTDNPPPGMSFIPGTVIVNGVSQPSFNPVSGFSVGTINAGAIVTVSFQVKVNALPAEPAPAQFVNKAGWTYDFISCAGFSPESGFLETNPNIIPAARIAPTKTVTPTGAVGVGQQLTYTITIPNSGLAPTSGTTLTDLIPVGTTYVAGSTTMNGIAVPDLVGVMPFVGTAQVNAPGKPLGVIGIGESAVVTFKVTVNPSPPSIITNTATIDPDGAGPAGPIAVSAVNTPLTPPVGGKTFLPTTISAGSISLLTININNANGQSLTNLATSDTLPAGLVIANPANVTTTCPGGTAVATAGGITLGLSGGSVPATGSCTVSANVTSQTRGTYTNIIPAGAITTTNAGSNVAPATAQLVVLQGPTLNKSFSPSTIAPGGVSVLTISVVNPTGVAINNINVTDNFPTGITIANPAGVTNSCGGGVTATPGAGSVALVGGSVIGANICTITVNVTATALGNYNNTIPAGGLTSSGGTNANAAQADLSVSAPAIAKSFSPVVVSTGGVSALTITLTNPTNQLATNASFTDVFPTAPAQMSIANTTVTNTCGGSLTNQTGGALANGNTGIRLVGGQIAAGGSCYVTVNATAGLAGNYVNTIAAGGLVTSAGNSVAATTATLSVGQPRIEKTFGSFAAPQTTVAEGGTVQLQFRVTNPNAAAINLTSLTDVFPAGITVANTTTATTCTGASTFTSNTNLPLAVGQTGIRITGGSIPANSTCLLSVNVTSSTPGTYLNVVPAGGLITSVGPNAFAGSATIDVLNAPTIAKSFAPATISPSAVSILTITLSNTNGQTLTGATFSDIFPTAPGPMTLANTTTTNTCGGTLVQSNNSALATGAGSVRLNGGSIPGNGSCQIAVNVTANAVGSYVNTIAVGGLVTANGGSNKTAATANLQVNVLPPSISKTFAQNPVGRNQSVKLTFTITNPNATLSMLGVAFTDALPSTPGQMQVAPVPNVAVSNCGAGTVTAAAGANSISFSGGTVAVGATCTVSVDVVSAVAGNYNNVSGLVSSTNAGTGNSASAAIRVLDVPAAAKGFQPTAVSVGGTSLLSVTISNPNASDTLLGGAINDTYPAGIVNSATPNPQVQCSAGSTATFTGGVAGGNTIGMTGGSLAPGGFCRVSVNVIGTALGTYTNTTGNVSSSNAGTGQTASANIVVGVNVSGFVYFDSNINNVKDGAEAGTGLVLYAKLINAGVVTQVVTVSATTGAYTLAGVQAGNYSVIIDDNAVTTDLVPTVPAGWSGTEQPTQSRSIVVGTTAVANINFGLNNAARITGRVFNDNGVTGGTPNDGASNGGELGIANVTVRLTNCTGTTLATTTTDGGGQFSLQVPAAVATGAALCVTQTAPSGYIETGGNVGSTSSASGVYTRSTSTINFSYAAGVGHSALQFGNVLVNTLSTDGLQTAMPATSVNFAHTFVAGSGGQVTFATASVASPANSAWSDVIYKDTNCNGVLEAGEPPLTGPQTVVAGEQICLIVKQFVPSTAAIGAQNVVTITANFNYTNSAPALSQALLRTDTTTVGNAASAGLRLTKAVNSATALPGATLVYTITYRNDSTGPLNNLVINDTTPAYTTFVNALCVTPLPNSLTGCTVTTSPTVGGVGSLVWTFTGTLAPASQGSVTFSVQVKP